VAGKKTVEDGREHSRLIRRAAGGALSKHTRSERRSPVQNTYSVTARKLIPKLIPTLVDFAIGCKTKHGHVVCPWRCSDHGMFGQ
jgi:hypothetical protein